MPTQVRRPTSITTLSGGSSIAWTSASNAIGDDGLYATCQTALVGPTQSQWLMMTVCGFSIPSDATNIALYYSCKRKASGANNVNTEPYTIEGGSIAQSLGALGHWTTSDHTETTVFPLTTGLTYSLLNASDFGLAIRVTFDNGDGVTPVIASIDDCYLTATYDSASSRRYPVGGAFSRCENVGEFARSNTVGTFARSETVGTFERQQ